MNEDLLLITRAFETLSDHVIESCQNIPNTSPAFSDVFRILRLSGVIRKLLRYRREIRDLKTTENLSCSSNRIHEIARGLKALRIDKLPRLGVPLLELLQKYLRSNWFFAH